VVSFSYQAKEMPTKKKHMQKTINRLINSAIIFCVILWILLLASFLGILKVATALCLTFLGAFILFFVPVSVYINRNNQNRNLRLPGYLSIKKIKFIRVICLVLLMAAGLIFGFVILSKLSQPNADMSSKVYANYLNGQFALVTVFITLGLIECIYKSLGSSTTHQKKKVSRKHK